MRYEEDIEEEKQEESNQSIILLDNGPGDVQTVGLYGEMNEERVGEVIYSLLEIQNKFLLDKEDNKKLEKSFDFYISTAGGSATEMFALYDVMRILKKSGIEIHTFGLGKVYSAGTLILSAGTIGKRKIAKNTRVMIHNVISGNHGDLPNLENELGLVKATQQQYIDCLVKETKMTKRKIKKLLTKNINVYLTADEAVEMGLVDIVV